VSPRLVVLPGDGIGPEVTAVALRVLRQVCDASGIALHTEERLIGGRAVDETGDPLPADTLAACKDAGAVLFGACGGPKWDHLRGPQRCEQGLLRLRHGMDVFANVRPVRVHPRLAGRTPLRDEVVRGTDLVIVRELTGGAYFGEPRERSGSGPGETARDTTVYTAREVDRVARVAFELARGRRKHLTSVDKANVLITSQLWRDRVNAVAKDFPDVTLEHRLVDAFAMELVRRPTEFDVVVTENLFGDILSDEAGVLAGSLGLLPSASLGADGSGLYEPIHGSAPDIAGRGIANPYGATLSAALLLRHSLHRDDLAALVEAAVDDCISEDILGPDLGGTLGTDAIADALQREVGNRLLTTGAPA
jgi:3-isopropylmalate dehydrogenase